ncbi:hypothetical protein B0T16DRAFT_447800 [Cercophora newfieldiana]|uniref:PLL-like beta propeller domain-containing protein n=1 Tax=Cercophora newfieldiana TaxID=92897 RepID=A0AA40CM36_9PEZI|nr:hypothetical protein B0T16DRAFT_447800 [Cercophora newfieldiana]
MCAFVPSANVKLAAREERAIDAIIQQRQLEVLEQSWCPIRQITRACSAVSAVSTKSYPEPVDGDGRSYPEHVGAGAPPLPPKYVEVGESSQPYHQLPDDGATKKGRFSRRCWIGLVLSPSSSSRESNSAASAPSDANNNNNGNSPTGISTAPNTTSPFPTARSACRDTVCPQPDAIAWNFSTRISVVAVADPDHSARTQMWSPEDATWQTEWKNIAGKATSAVTLCTVKGERLDFWSGDISNKVVAHNFLGRFKLEYWAPDLSKDWQGSADWKAGPTIKGRPGVACRYDDYGHDIFAYDGTGATVRHSAYRESTAWTPVFTMDSGAGFKGFQSDPVLLASANDRLEFFGIGVDKKMYYGAWSKQAGHSRMVDLGGAFQSVPSAVVTRSGRVDVVALGMSDTLMHRVLQGGQWSAEWEDLGVFGNSAPLAFNLTTTPERVGVFVLGENGELNQTVWEVSSELSWKGLWAGMGGNLTSSYFRS